MLVSCQGRRMSACVMPGKEDECLCNAREG